MDTESINKKHLASLHPEVARRVAKLIELAKRDGFTLQIVQSLRTVEEQNKLFAKGRTMPGKKVTNARGGKSWHNYGLAADVAPVINGKVSWDEKLFDWSRIGAWARSAALEWGGSWKKLVDRPHVQWTGDLTIARALDLYFKGGLKKVWSEVHTSESAAALQASILVTERDDEAFDDAAEVHEKEVQEEPSQKPSTNETKVIPQEEPQPYGFWSKIKKDIYGLGIFNGGVNGISEYAKQGQSLGLPASFWTRLVYIALALTVVWFLFRVIHYLVDSWKQNKRQDRLAAINTNPDLHDLQYVKVEVNQ